LHHPSISLRVELFPELFGPTRTVIGLGSKVNGTDEAERPKLNVTELIITLPY
jgi:hypothetical protein